tara:strand:- start:89286 stop:90332 length:1047 start_codon:yes stop_codon:yes gene_type:complete
MNSSLVSVIIPCYNAASTIGETIESVLAQSHTAVEIIVVDDGSTDNSLQVLAGYRDRIRLVSGPNRGGCAARNTGFDLSAGEYIQFLDADDLIHPEKLRIQIEQINERRDAAAMACRWHFMGDAKRFDCLGQEARNEVTIEMPGREFLAQHILGNIKRILNPRGRVEIGYLSTSCWLIPRTLFLSTGGWNEGLRMCQDSEFVDRLCVVSSRVVSTNMFAVQFRADSKNSVSKGKSRRHAESYLEYCRLRHELFTKAQIEFADSAVELSYLNFLKRFEGRYRDLDRIALNNIRGHKDSLSDAVLGLGKSVLFRILGTRNAARVCLRVMRSRLKRLESQVRVPQNCPHRP